MTFQKIEPTKHNEKGKIYDIPPEGVSLENVVGPRYITRKEGSISGDGHDHPYTEMFYLMQGTAKVTIGDETRVIDTPHKITAEPHEVHTFEAMTDILLIIYNIK